MKNLIVVLIVLAMCVAAQAGNFSVWNLANDTSFQTRFGYCASEKTEFGIEAAWLEENNVPMVWGAYGLYCIPDSVKFPNPIPLHFLPDEFTATPYVGVHTGLNLNTKGTFVGPIAGLWIEKIIIIEWQYVISDFQLDAVDDEDQIVLGLKFTF